MRLLKYPYASICIKSHGLCLVVLRNPKLTPKTNLWIDNRHCICSFALKWRWSLVNLDMDAAWVDQDLAVNSKSNLTQLFKTYIQTKLNLWLSVFFSPTGKGQYKTYCIFSEYTLSLWWIGFFNCLVVDSWIHNKYILLF